MNSLPKVIIIVGPTASGKTALSLRLAKKFNGEIISADSRQIYRGMDIGTAKAVPNAKLKTQNSKSRREFYSQGIRHHLIDIKNPNQNYMLAEWKNDAQKAIKKILLKNKQPIVVGGTGLYIKTLVDNLNIPEVKPDPKLRSRLEKELKKDGLNLLYNKLINLDPEAAYIVDPNNPRRIIRALEIALATGKPYSAQRKKGPKLFDFLILGVDLPAGKLKNNIEKRADLMFKAGLVKEVKGLIKKYGKKHQAFDAIYYREIISSLEGQITRSQARELAKKNTWHFAKRQYTWFKKMPVVWIKTRDQAEKETKKFLAK